MRYLLSIFLVVLALMTFVDAETNSSNRLKVSAGLIECIDSTGAKLQALDDCLTFGLVSIGDSREQATATLGNPARMIAGIDTAKIGIFPLTASKPGDDPVLLVTLANDTVTTLQLQGRGTTDPFSFAGMSLGDSVTVLLKLLGQPSNIEPNEQFHSELWEYAGYPFSFEIENSRIFSIMIWKPSR